MKQLILKMIEDLQGYKSNNKTLMSELIQQRLNKSFDLYYSELEKSLQLLSRKHEKSVLKRINKLNGKTD